jgi:murein DD-endopeptidase MepM/ murein hydrolase activator NlpD
MESYTLIFVRDQHARPVQIAVPKVRVKQAAITAAAVVLFGAVLAWDYWQLRADNAELADLRIEAFEQREEIAAFRGRLVEVDQQIEKVAELERKVRIIANLPGTAGVGGEGVAELAPEGLANGASNRADSLDVLLEQLADKRQRLISMPSIWPAKGWLTSRYGARVSPFTGKRQVHAGIDIAAASGTSIYAPARGRVTFSGRKGPLGNTVVLDHGFGVKTVYGHTKEIHVSTGETVERGQEIAAIGSTGRSTGPHLHYVVEVDGKTTDPLNYIFD